MGLNCRSSTGLGETEIPLLEGAHRVSHTPGPGAKAVLPYEPGPDLLAGLGGSPGEAGGSCGFPGVIKAGGRHSSNLCELWLEAHFGSLAPRLGPT